MKTNFKQELIKAKTNGYAIPAFNWDNLEMLKGIVAAAEEMNSPVILMVTESAAKYMGIEYATQIGLEAVRSSKIPAILFWDHGFEKELIKKAIDNGFDAVMLDASKETFENNVKDTKEIVEYAKKHNVQVESEIGHVGGKEDDRDSEGNGYTIPSEAIEFNELTKIDALAIAAGTAHGLYKGEIKLQFELMNEIVDSMNTPIVLHGSSDVPLGDLQKAIRNGITKINIGTDLKIAYANALKQWFSENPNGFDARKFGAKGIEAVKKAAIEKIVAFGSNDRA